MNIDGIRLHKGMPLATSKPDRYTNAVVFSVDDQENKVEVYTDFCNKLVMSLEQLKSQYSLPQHYKDFYNYFGEDGCREMYDFYRWAEDNVTLAIKMANEVGVGVVSNCEEVYDGKN